MQSLPSRTGSTALTDDHLLLFDFMFDSLVPFRLLRRESYPVHMNVTYTHTLDDRQLQETLQDLQARDLIHLYQHESVYYGSVQSFYSLTETGGQLWETERQPLWDAYCTDGQEHAAMVTVRAPVLATAEAFLIAAHDCGLYRCELKQRTTIAHHPAKYSPEVNLIPWKIFPEEYEVRAPLRADRRVARIDWPCYEQRRWWWRTISELATLPRHTIAPG